MRTNLMCCAIVLALTLGCSQKSGFDMVMPGSAVTVTERNGSTVSGRLVEVSSDEVVVDPPEEGRRVLRRDEVASIAVLEDRREATVVERLAMSMSDDGPSVEPALVRVRMREVTVPAGATIDAALETPVGSDVSRVETPVVARVVRDLQIDGDTIIPSGATLSGSVVNVVSPAKVKGRGSVAFRFDQLTTKDETYDIRTATLSRRSRSTTKLDAMKIGFPAVGGAIVGSIIGGGKGAAIGGATGAGAGTALVMSTRGEHVHLPEGTAVKVQLTKPVRLRVRI